MAESPRYGSAFATDPTGARYGIHRPTHSSRMAGLNDKAENRRWFTPTMIPVTGGVAGHGQPYTRYLRFEVAETAM